MTQQMEERGGTQRVVITLPREMYEQLKELAEEQRRPMSEECRMAIDRHLARFGRKTDATVTWGRHSPEEPGQVAGLSIAATS